MPSAMSDLCLASLSSFLQPSYPSLNYREGGAHIFTDHIIQIGDTIPILGSTNTDIEHASKMCIVESITKHQKSKCMAPDEIHEMKDEVRKLLKEQMGPVAKLELIDAVQRLGLGYLFVSEIKHELHSIHQQTSVDSCLDRCDRLHCAALRFRLFRQHGFYEVPKDVFQQFMNDAGVFMSEFGEDVKGLLSLYEASFLAFPGETVMDKAKLFSVACLKCLKNKISSPVLALKIKHALDMPIHWRPNRVEAKCFMEVYEDEPDMNPTLLKLAMLDYNAVQSVHQEEFRRLSRWWTQLRLGMSMDFSRDNLTEHFIWNLVMVFEPEYNNYRDIATKITGMITLIDDVYDKLGTSLEELELLTDLIIRWDITRADELPPVMRSSFQVLYNVTNEAGNWMLKERGIDAGPYLQKGWADQCKAYLVEAKWCHKGTEPLLGDYLRNAVRTFGGIIVLLCCFLITGDDITDDKLEYITRIPSVVRCSTLISRLNNDLVPTSGELSAGDQLNSVQCFINETGAEEEEARKHIQNFVPETWKALNQGIFNINDKHRLPAAYVGACMNLARASHWIYRYGDGHEVRSREAKQQLASMLLQPAVSNTFGI